MNDAPDRIWAVYAEGSESRDELPEVFASESRLELAALERCYEAQAHEYVRADLAGAKVKPLVWENGHAHGVGHHYFTKNGKLFLDGLIANYELHEGLAWELEEAAQADYERRILSALEGRGD